MHEHHCQTCIDNRGSPNVRRYPIVSDAHFYRTRIHEFTDNTFVIHVFNLIFALLKLISIEQKFKNQLMQMTGIWL
ncbi:MAG: hypothetical protein K9J28_05270, partial [Sulfuritalea sp.]|nr:hypothetical protein [Sulfuritalea sp.]